MTLNKYIKVHILDETRFNIRRGKSSIINRVFSAFFREFLMKLLLKDFIREL